MRTNCGVGQASLNGEWTCQSGETASREGADFHTRRDVALDAAERSEIDRGRQGPLQEGCPAHAPGPPAPSAQKNKLLAQSSVRSERAETG